MNKITDFIRFDSNIYTQGIIGKCKFNGKRAFWKISKHPDFTCESEYNTSNIIHNSPLTILNHFVRTYGIDKIYTSPKDIFKRTCLFMEEIKGVRLLDLINEKGEGETVVNIIKQVLIAISAAQQLIDFTHYDLHIENILVQKTRDDIHVYVMPDDTVHVVKTYGMSPVIIDYGYCYTNQIKRILPTMCNNDVGFQPYHSNPITDATTLLSSTIFQMNKPHSPLSYITLKLFNNIKNHIKWQYGWLTGFKNIPQGLDDVLYPPITNVRRGSILYTPMLLADLIQPLISPSFRVTHQKRKLKFYHKYYAKFYYEWIIIENIISHPLIEGFILKSIISSMIDGSNIEEELYDIFHKRFPVNYDNIVQGIYAIAHEISLFYNECASVDVRKRNKIYNKLHIKSSLDIYKYIESCTPPPIYYPNDRVKIFNLKTSQTHHYTLNKHESVQLNRQNTSLIELVC